MPCHCWRSSVERLHCRAQVMRKKQEPWHWSKQVKRIPHEVQQVPQGTEGRCCSNSSLREKLLKLFNLVIEKARAPSPSFFFSIPEDYCHCYIIPNLTKVVKGWASLPSILIKLHLQQRYLLLICTLVAASLMAGHKGQFSFVTSSIMSGFSSRTDLKSSGLQKSGSCC